MKEKRYKSKGNYVVNFFATPIPDYSETIVLLANTPVTNPIYDK